MEQGWDEIDLSRTCPIVIIISKGLQIIGYRLNLKHGSDYTFNRMERKTTMI